jgi:hypothetical protein
MASRNYIQDEVKIMTRGEAYLTPMKEHHIAELAEVLSEENRRELKLLGYADIIFALRDMYDSSEVYIVRNKDKDLVFAGGLWHEANEEWPQMFAMFSYKVRENFKLLARGSKMLVSFFDQTQHGMSMTILADYEFMIDWAAWLGFEAVGVSENGFSKYVEFVRCNPNKSNVYNLTSRPVTH